MADNHNQQGGHFASNGIAPIQGDHSTSTEAHNSNITSDNSSNSLTYSQIFNSSPNSTTPSIETTGTPSTTTSTVMNNTYMHHQQPQYMGGMQQATFVPITSPPSSSTLSSPGHGASSPYKKPLSLTKDRIPTHLHHFLETPVSERPEFMMPSASTASSDEEEDDSEVTEVTPATITLRSLNGGTQSAESSATQSATPSKKKKRTTTTTTTTTSAQAPQVPQQYYQGEGGDMVSPIPTSANALATIPGGAGATGDISTLSTQFMNDDRTITRSGQNYIEITEFLNFPQSEAAKKLGIPTSTLSKRWKEAARGRKWPFRKVSKIDKEIMTLLHNIPAGSPNDLPPEVDASLVTLLKKRQEKLKPVFIRM